MIETLREKATEVTIRAGVCPACGALLYPIPLVCPCGQVLGAGGPSLEEREIAGSCKLLTWTRLTAVAEGFADGEMTLGMVEFPNGVRALGLLETDAAEVGMVLEAHAQSCNAGEYRHGPRYVFREAICASS